MHSFNSKHERFKVLIKGPKSISSDLSNLLKYILVHLTIILVSTSASSIGGAQIRPQMFQNSSNKIKGFVTTVILWVPKRIYSKFNAHDGTI